MGSFNELFRFSRGKRHPARATEAIRRRLYDRAMPFVRQQLSNENVSTCQAPVGQNPQEWPGGFAPTPAI
jgi:hypothetical protein